MTRASHAALAALLLASAAISPVNAADGFYIGGGVGTTSVEESVNGGTLDADDTAWKGFIGWRFDVIPLIDLAVEGAYTEFGKPSQNVGGQEARLKLSGPSLAGLLIFPLGPIDLFGKAGWLWWDSERTIGGVSSERTGSDSLLGRRHRLSHLENRRARRIRALPDQRRGSTGALVAERAVPVLAGGKQECEDGQAVFHRSHSMGRRERKPIHRRCSSPAPGSEAWRTSPSIQSSSVVAQRPPRKLRAAAAGPDRRTAARRARALSITTPISVLSRAERGSKLNEPTKIRLRSTAKVLACRLASELPPAAPRRSLLSCPRVRFSS